MASFLALLKGIIEFLGLAKWFYNETKTLPSEKEAKVSEENKKQEEQSKKTGRPTW